MASNVLISAIVENTYFNRRENIEKEGYKNRKRDVKKMCLKMPIKNKGERIATLNILGRREFSIIGCNNEIIMPSTYGETLWCSSEYKRNQIAKKIVETCKVSKSEAKDIVNDLSVKVYKKIKNGEVRQCVHEENQQILDSIEKVIITPLRRDSRYSIYLDGKVIELKGRNMISGPGQFCKQYFFRFHKMIYITPDEWSERFVPYMLSEDIRILNDY